VGATKRTASNWAAVWPCVARWAASIAINQSGVLRVRRPAVGVGEIALLRRIRRTATVRATSDLRLKALRSDRFLPVVLGYTPSAREAGVVVESMLDRFTPRDDPEHPPQ